MLARDSLLVTARNLSVEFERTDASSGTLPSYRSTSATQGETMAAGIITILSFLIEPGLKEAPRIAAEQAEHFEEPLPAAGATQERSK